MKYVKKPVVIDAFQWDGTVAGLSALRDALPGVTTDSLLDKAGTSVLYLGIQTLEGRMQVSKGDFVIRGVEGEFYPCKPSIFHKTYTLAA